MSSGCATPALLSATLSAPAERSAVASSRERTPPPTVRGMPRCSRTLRMVVQVGAPPLGGGADVQHDEFVGALALVLAGALDGVARVPEG